jgi:hypothetical protein
MNLKETGSQKVGGSNLPSSTREANQTSQHLSIHSNSYTKLALSLQRLIDGFLLGIRV